MNNNFIPLIEPGPYAVNSDGEFLRLSYRGSGNPKICTPEHPRSDGYMQVNININGKNEMRLIHDLVWEAFNKMKVPAGYIVHHKNGIKTDNRLENLELMTRSEHIKEHRFPGMLKKKVFMYDKQGNLKQVFNSATEAGIYLNVATNAVCQCCRGLSKTCKNKILKYGS